MIYKGLMGEQEVLTLFGMFSKIYRFALRGSKLILIDTKEELAETDIEVEIYNEIVNTPTTSSKPILVLTSNSSMSIVTNFILFQSESIQEMLIEEFKRPEYSKLIESNSIVVFTGLDKPTSVLSTGVESTGNVITAIQSRGKISNIETPRYTLKYITSRLNLGGFDMDSIPKIRETANYCNEYKDAGLNPTLLIDIQEERITTTLLINTGYTKNQLSKNFNITPGGFGFGSISLTPIFKLSENFRVPNFDKLVDPDAQSSLLKKVKGYVNRRVEKIDDIRYYFTDAKTYFIHSSVDKNFFKPSSSTINNIQLMPNRKRMDSDEQDSIKTELKKLNNILQLSNSRIDMKLGNAIETSIKQYQEIWGSYKPLSRKFFRGNQENLIRVRELFYNILYAYVDRALGGYISSSGQRKYTPSTTSSDTTKMLKQFPPLTDYEKKLIRYINRADDPFSDFSVLKDYSLFIKHFMEEKADDVYASEDYAINYIPNTGQGNVSDFFRNLLKYSGFSVPEQLTDMYLVSIKGVDATNMHDMIRYLQSYFELKNEPDFEVTDTILRNLYQYFIFIDINNQEIKVIRPSLVDDATQFSINFQDWDIRMDLTNLINNLISKPKDLLIGDKERVGLSKPASPSEKSLYFLSEPNLKRQGVIDHPLTLHYEPLRFNRVTRQKSGHLFFENTHGILVVFPFDTFYHDIEGQGDRTIDICYTSVPHIYDKMLLSLLNKKIMEVFNKWLEENQDVFITQKVGSMRQTRASLPEITMNSTPIITPTVWGGIFRRAVKERLEGHVFRNSERSKAACVFVNPLEGGGFFSSGDEGMRMGVSLREAEPFPFNWYMFGGDHVSDLDPRLDENTKNKIETLWANEGVTGRFEKIIEEMISNSTTDEKYPMYFLIELYKYFISNVKMSDAIGARKVLRETVREEIKEYLKKNPEAIQLKNIARRNMSRN
jgi:hypothetical protein